MANIIKKFYSIAVVPYRFYCRQRDISSREEKGQRDPQISPQSLAGEAVPQPFCLSAENTLRSTNRALAYYPIETEDIAHTTAAGVSLPKSPGPWWLSLLFPVMTDEKALEPASFDIPKMEK